MGLNQANLSDDGWEVIVDPLYIYMINMHLTMTLHISYKCAYAYPYYTLNGISSSTISYHIHSDRMRSSVGQRPSAKRMRGPASKQRPS